MVDLKAQYTRLKEEIELAVLNTLERGWYVGGDEVSSFRSNLESFLNVKKVIPCGNGTDALQISLMALGVSSGDEVIVPSFTYIATAEVIALLGAVPVFVDVDPDNFNLDPALIEQAISPKTKAIIVVHLYGQCAPIERILDVADKEGIPVIEDGAQSIGAVYEFSDGRKVKSGTMGAVGCTSFFPSKNLGAYGDGGAIFANDEVLGEKIRMIANHGQSRKYHHDIVGVNSRLDTIQAAILNVKLKHLEDFTLRRQSVAKYYTEFLNSCKRIKTPKLEKYSTHVFHQYTVKFESEVNRNKVMHFLKELGVPSVVYYPVPQHLQKGFQGFCRVGSELKYSVELPKLVLSLPIHTEMTNEQMDYVCTALSQALEKL